MLDITSAKTDMIKDWMGAAKKQLPFLSNLNRTFLFFKIVKYLSLTIKNMI